MKNARERKAARTAPAASQPPASQLASQSPATPPAAVRDDSLRAAWIARAIVAVGAIVTFARSVPHPLLRTWDDNRFLLENPDTTTYSWESFRSIWTEVHFQAYHPLHLLSYWIDAPWAGTDGPVIHATSVVLWCLALWAVLAVLRELGLSWAAATVATLFFGLHTVQVEAVTWATGRKEILAIGLGCGAFLLHLRSNDWRDRAAWGSRALFVLAALAKTTALPLPAVMLLADVVLRKKPWRDALRAQAPTLVVGLAIGAAVIAIWDEHSMIRGEESDRGDVTFLVPATIAHHLWTALWPAHTAPLYPLAREQALPVAASLITCALVLVAMAIAWRRRDTTLGARIVLGLGAFLLLLAPASNLVPVYFQWQDRYLCFPLLGLALVAGALLDAAKGARGAYVVAGLALAALAGRTVQYQAAWRGDDALWENAVGAQPRAFYAWIKLGEVRRDRGDHGAALRAYQEAIEIAPQLRLGHAAFFSALMRRDEDRHGIEGESRAAVESQRFMMRLDDPMALRELAGELAEAGYRDAVTYVLARSLDIEPIDDDRLERAIVVQLELGNEWLARFYVGRLTREPVLPQVRRYVAIQRYRLARERGENPPFPFPVDADGDGDLDERAILPGDAQPPADLPPADPPPEGQPSAPGVTPP